MTCAEACEMLGPTGPVIVAIIALVWGEYQRRRAKHYRQLSLRPPPMGVSVSMPTIPPGAPQPPPAMPKTFVAARFEDDTPTQRPSRKRGEP